MVPVVLAAEFFQVFFQKRSHFDDPVRHALDFSQPLLVECGVVEDLRSDASTVDGRVGIQRPDKDLQLRVDSLLLFC